AVFRDDYRRDENVEYLTALCLDDDSGTRSLDDVATIWSDYEGLVHTTKRHTDAAPRHRTILAVSRPMAPAEHSTIYAWAAARVGGALDDKTKNVGRLWFAPPPGCSVRRMMGSPIDVDAALAGTSSMTTPATAPRSFRRATIPSGERNS